MGWVKFRDRRPPEQGYYHVVRFYPGDAKAYNPTPPYREVKIFMWTEKMKLEEEYSDRCVYKKYKCFIDAKDQEQKIEEILYWYKLDEIPEEE